jgi:anti-sigma factor RsiW
MNKTSLSSLYRRLTATATPALEADDLAAAADGTLAAGRRDGVAAKLAASPAEAKVVRMLRELRTDSEALAFGIARTGRATATHDRPRIAAGRRHANVMRWTAAMAACLVAVVGVFTLRQPHTATMPTAHTVARADVIFTDHELTRPKTPVEGDELFRGNFNG